MFLNAIRLKKCMAKPLIDVFCICIFIPDWYKTQEMYYRVVVNDPFLVVYCPSIYIKLKECVMKLLMIICQH